MPFVPQGGHVAPEVLVRNLAHASVDPDAGTLTVEIKDTLGVTLSGFPVTYPTGRVGDGGWLRIALGHYSYDWVTDVGQALGTYPVEWNGAELGSALPAATDEIEVIPAGTLSTAILTAAQVRALVSTELLDADLEDVIAREQSALEAALMEAGGGPLTGSRTEVIVTTLGDDYRLLRLSRTTDAVEVTDNGVLVDSTDIRLLNGRFLRRVATGRWARGRWLGVVEVRYTPNDLAWIQKNLIDLIRDSLETTDAGGQVQSESIGEYSYTLSSGAVRSGRQWRIVRSLLPPAEPVSVSLSDTSLPYWVGTVRPGS